MRPRFLSFLTLALCGLLLCGNVPALVHVALCHDHGDGLGNVNNVCQDEVRENHHSGCTGHAHSHQPGEGSEDQPASPNHHSHDSETCSICLSLMAGDRIIQPGIASFQLGLVAQFATDSATRIIARRPEHRLFARGPPMMIAPVC